MSDYRFLDAYENELAGKPTPADKAAGNYSFLEQAMDQSDANDLTRLGISAKQSLEIKPENYIKARELEKATGVPADVAARNLAEVEYRKRLDDLERTMRSAPTLGVLMQDPAYLKRTHDDIDALAQVEFQTKGFRAASEFKRKALDEEVGKTFGNAIINYKVDRARPRDTLDYITQGGSAVASSLWSANSGLWGIARAAADVVGLDGIAEWAAGYQRATGRTATEMLGDPTQQSFVERSIYSGLQSFGQNMLTIPLAMASGGSAGMALGPMTAMTGGAEYGKARDKNVSIPQALVYGSSQAIIDYATEKAPVGRFLEDIAKGSGFGKMLWGQVLKEIPGEQAATLLQDLNEWAVINPNKPFSSYIAERPSAAAQTLIATIVGVGGQVTTMKGVETLVGAVTGQNKPFADPFVMKSEAAMRALEAERMLTGIIDSAGKSASIARDPSAVQELINEADENGSTEVYINARTFANVFNQSAVETATALGVTPEVLNDALAANGDITVPLATLATAVAQDQALRPVLEHARTDAGDMSPADARLWQSQQGEQFKAEAEQILSQRVADQEFQAEVEAVHQNILGQLTQARRFNDQVNQRYAAMVRDFYVTMADRAGMTVSEMAQAYPLRVVAEGTGQFNQNNQAERGRALAGGEIANSNGFFYKGGQFLPNTTAEPGKWKVNGKWVTTGEMLIGPGEKATQPTPFSSSIYNSLRVYVSVDDNGKMDFNPAVKGGGVRFPGGESVTPDAEWTFHLRGIPDGKSYTMQELVDAYNNGMRWIDLNPKAETITTDTPPSQMAPTYGQPAKQDKRLPTAMEGGRPYDFGYDYQALPADVRAVVDEVIGELPEPEVTKQKLVELKDTPWAKQAIAGALLRDAIKRIVSGQEPRAPSYLDGPSLAPLRKELKGGGMEAVFNYLARNSIIGNASKPESAVASSYLNCQPTKGCATYCYAASGERYHGTLAKAELTTLAIEADPARAAQMTLEEWQYRPNATMGGALRMFDRGDGDARWIPYLDALAEAGVRTHIFSKRADFLAQVNPMHLRLLSMDSENEHLIDKVPEGVGVAYVFEGSDAEIEFLTKHADKIQLVLPVKLDTGFVKKDKVAALPKELQPNVCPVDKGVVTIASGYRVVLADGTEKVFNPANMRAGGGKSATVMAHEAALAFQKANAGSMIKSIGGYALKDQSGNVLGHFTENGLAKATKMAEKIGGQVVEVNGWNCVNCDRKAGIGCYAGNTTEAATQKKVVDISAITGRKIERETERAIAELESRLGIRLPADQRQRISDELAGRLREAQGRDDGRAAGNGVAGSAQNAGPATGSGEASGTVPSGRLAQGERGSFDPASNTIALLEGADLSTFLHESGHFFLEVMADMAAYPGAPVQIRQDFETTLKWFGIQATPDADLINTWTRMTLEEKRPYHEQWARGFEAYLFEGNAPSVELQGMFQRFRAWLVTVYQSLKALNVELTDEVRGVFDRMLASDRAIQTAEAVRNLAPIFQTAEQAGMTAEEWAQYQAEAGAATENAVDEVQTRSIRDMRWMANAKAKRIKELQATAKAVRAQVMMEARREVMGQPLYRAWQFLTGKDPMAEKVAKAKADTDTLNPAEDDLLVAIIKLGGLDKTEAVSTWGIDLKDVPAPKGVGKPILRANNGRSLDGMAEALAERGYLDVDENGKWDLAQFEDLFMSAIKNGAEHYSHWNDASQFRKYEDAPEENITTENTPYGKLNTDILKAMYGSDDAAIWRLLSALRMTSGEGMHPDVVANLFGFTSGDELVRRLAVAERPEVVIEGLTDQMMLEQFGDLASARDIELAAERAIHNDVRARVLTRELNALRKATGKPNVMLQAARLHAEQWLARQKVKDAVRHSPHAAAEGRSNRAAMDALGKGDTAGAAQHKLDALLNNQLTRQSIKAGEEVRRAVTYLKKFDKKGTRKSIDGAYLDQIDALLERFDLRQVSDKQLQKRASLAAWVAEQEALGLDPVVDSRLVEDAQRQHYSTLSLEEFRGLVDTVKSIEHLGRLKNKLLTAKDKRELAAIVADLEKSIIDNANRDVTTINAVTSLEKGAKILRGFLAQHRKFASIVREMDGGKDGGKMWEILVRSMNEAGDAEVQLRSDMSEKFAALFAGLKGIKLNEKIAVPEIGGSLRREELIAIALNSGNEGNRQRLLDGGINEQARAISEAQLLALLNRLSDQEWNFVEGVWAMIEANRPAIAAQEKALTGVEPKWVEPSPFTLENGRTIRGGYYPAKYNGTFSTRSNELEAVTDLRQQMMGAAGRSSTRNGYTKERAKEVSGRPLDLNLGVIARHINEVTHRLAWQQWLIDARRVMAAPAIDRAIRDHYGPEILNEMKQQLVDIAAGDNGPANAMDQVMTHIRNGTTVAGMGWNIMTSLMQPIGLTQSIERVGARWIGQGLAQFIAHPFKATKAVHEQSGFMANRAKTINREINDVLNRIRSERMSKVEASYFYLIQKFQQMVDVPTWLGAYNKALAEGNGEERAIALADQAVIDSQGGGQLKDLARIQRGGAGQKLFTNFYSFFNTTYQRAVENGRATDFSNPLQVGKLAANYLLLFVLPVIWSMALKEALKGDDHDEDPEKLLTKYLREQLNYLLGSMILVREIGSAISGFQGYQGPAGTRFFSEVGKLVKQIGQGDVDTALVKAAANTVGVAFHLPSGQVVKSVEGVVAVADGKAGPAAVLVGPPVQDR